MALFEKTREAYRRGLEGDHRYARCDHEVTCSHCGGRDFDESEVLLNTTGMTFVGLDWANKKAVVYACRTCGHLEWFIDVPER